MKEKWNFIWYLMWFAYLIITAVFMFGHGFLLSRKTLSDVTECAPLKDFGCDGRELADSSHKPSWRSCTDEAKIRQILLNPGAPLVCAPTRNRVLFVLVDALRYDFTDLRPELAKPLWWQNRLPVVRETLAREPARARLFRFMADPPTTTLQRVKALVTGSLPTFIDASSNFAAMELQEDNIIDQVAKDGKAILLGDDTWARLMPGKWFRSHAQYSFHTWDLDTVDIEVDSKIYDELKNDDWSLLVAHYLGVDHAGHRYGPNHPEMARKLNETNIRLKKIIENLPPDVLLYVVGDHGMTETGDHGGESKAERTAALFAYRGAGLGGRAPETDVGREVQQTDFAPTLSAALGRPPPAPSLGSLLFPVLPEMSTSESLLHLTNNLKQISRYLVRYGEESQQISLDKLAQLINATREHLDRATGVTTAHELDLYSADVRSLIDHVRSVFREVWVEFDSLCMLRALLLLVLAIFFNWLITEGLPTERLPPVFASSFVPTGLVSVAVCVALCYTAFYFQLLENLPHAIYLSTGLVSGAIVCMCVILHWDGIAQRWYEGRSQFYERFSRAALVASAAVLLSNSYIIEEGAGLSYLSLTVLALMAWNVGTLKGLALWVGAGAALGASRMYRGCREEQGACWTAGGGGGAGGGGAGGQAASRLSLVLALGSLAGVVATARRAAGGAGAAGAGAAGWRGHGLALAGLLAGAHWAAGWGALGSPARSRLLARAAWLVLGALFALLWRRERAAGAGAASATPPLVACSLLLYVANALVSGAAYAPSAALALISGFLALNIVANLKTDGSTKASLATRSSSSVACMWALLASYQFYGMGHHATLGHVRWAPAFHAGDPNYLPFPQPFGHIVIGGLVGLDLFGMPLLFGAATPLLALWGGGAAAGPRSQLAAVFSLCLKFALCFAIRVFACAIAATVHCRHLMIWGVFTPKLLFEFGACAAALLGTVLGAALAVWHLPARAARPAPSAHPAGPQRNS